MLVTDVLAVRYFKHRETNEDTPIEIILTGTDLDNETLSFSVTVEPENGIYAEGIYTPDENWFGTDTFSYIANDGIDDSEPAIVSIEVLAVNDIPVINLPDELYLDAMGYLEIDLANYSSDVENEELDYYAVTEEEIDVEFLDSIAIITSDMGWLGVETLIICADDGNNRVTVCDTVSVIKELSPIPVIQAIADVPEDQGGKVIVSFTGSCFDTDSLIVRPGESYQVEYLFEDNWMAANFTIAYGADNYVVLVTTLQDSMPGNPNIYDFRVIAGMEEGNFVSNIMSGYSLDNICPVVPSELLFDSGYLVWDEPVDEDFAYFSIYRDGDLLDYSTEPSMNIIGESGDYQASSIDCHGNESELSSAVSGGYPYGDVDHNIEVEAMDASLVLQYFCLLITDWEDWQIEIGDVDGNGVVEAYDAALILRYTVGIIDEFPVEGERRKN